MRTGQKGGEKSGDQHWPGWPVDQDPCGGRHGKGRPLNLTLSRGQVHDSQAVEQVLHAPKPPLAVTADKAYDSEKVCRQIEDEGALPIIPSRAIAAEKAHCLKRICRRHHKIENYFCRIKDWRRIAARCDKLARNFLAAVTLIGAL